MEKKNRITVRLSDKQLEILLSKARKERRSYAAVIRNFIDDLGKGSKKRS